MGCVGRVEQRGGRWRGASAVRWGRIALAPLTPLAASTQTCTHSAPHPPHTPRRASHPAHVLATAPVGARRARRPGCRPPGSRAHVPARCARFARFASCARGSQRQQERRRRRRRQQQGRGGRRGVACRGPGRPPRGCGAPAGYPAGRLRGPGSSPHGAAAAAGAARRGGAAARGGGGAGGGERGERRAALRQMPARAPCCLHCTSHARTHAATNPPIPPPTHPPTNQARQLAATAIDACLLLRRTDTLWGDLAPRFLSPSPAAGGGGSGGGGGGGHSRAPGAAATAAAASSPSAAAAAAAAAAFLDELLPHVLGDLLPSVAPEVRDERRGGPGGGGAAGGVGGGRRLPPCPAPPVPACLPSPPCCCPPPPPSHAGHAGACGALCGAGPAGAGALDWPACPCCLPARLPLLPACLRALAACLPVALAACLPACWPAGPKPSPPPLSLCLLPSMQVERCVLKMDIMSLDLNQARPSVLSFFPCPLARAWLRACHTAPPASRCTPPHTHTRTRAVDPTLHPSRPARRPHPHLHSSPSRLADPSSPAPGRCRRRRRARGGGGRCCRGEGGGRRSSSGSSSRISRHSSIWGRGAAAAAPGSKAGLSAAALPALLPAGGGLPPRLAPSSPWPGGLVAGGWVRGRWVRGRWASGRAVLVCV